MTATAENGEEQIALAQMSRDLARRLFPEMEPAKPAPSGGLRNPVRRWLRGDCGNG